MSPKPLTPKQDDVLAALEFAARIADRELASIERLHKRSLAYIGYVLTAAFVGFGAFGWVGYQNLRASAVQVAKQQVQAEVTKQVERQLTRENLTEIVHTEVRGYAVSDLQNQVRQEIRRGPLHEEIVRSASAQTRTLVDTIFAPRHLTAAQAKRLQDEIARFPDLRAYPIGMDSAIGNIEAYKYGQEVVAALTGRGGLLLIPAPDLIANIDTGIWIVYDQKAGPHFADELLSAFQNANIPARETYGQKLDQKSAQGSSSLMLFSGQQVISRTK